MTPAEARERVCETLGADERSGNDADQLAAEVDARLVACAATLRSLGRGSLRK